MNPDAKEDALLALRVHDGNDRETLRIEAARDGDAEARAWLCERLLGPVHRYTLRMLRNDADARDATQDTLVKVLKKLDQYDARRPFLAWALGIARNTCIDLYRQRQRRSWDEPGDVIDAAPTPFAVVAGNQDAARVQAALDRIGPMYREVLVLYHFEHLKYTDIAEVLELPLGTVMNRIFRARQHLRTAYEALGGSGEVMP
jgi:RNA polymerase sigma-70 factor (ECF subfamily)